MEDYTNLNEVFGIDAPLCLPEEKNIEYINVYVSPRWGEKHSEKTKKQISEKLKSKNIKPPNQKGKKWWYNSDGDTTISHECPGPGWLKGRPSVNNWSTFIK